MKELRKIHGNGPCQVGVAGETMISKSFLSQVHIDVTALFLSLILWGVSHLLVGREGFGESGDGGHFSYLTMGMFGFPFWVDRTRFLTYDL